MSRSVVINWFFFFNDTATTEIYTLSLHDAFRSVRHARLRGGARGDRQGVPHLPAAPGPVQHRRGHDPVPDDVPLRDRKSTRLNSSHANISYAVFCLKKKKYQLSSHVISASLSHY